MKKRICASCRAGMGGNDDYSPQEAEFFVKGRRPSDNSSGWTPYCAYLCEDHLVMMEEDGAEFFIARKLNH